jgi:hypothetical protein
LNERGFLRVTPKRLRDDFAERDKLFLARRRAPPGKLDGAGGLRPGKSISRQRRLEISAQSSNCAFL